jgi:hypothetical protein
MSVLVSMFAVFAPAIALVASAINLFGALKYKGQHKPIWLGISMCVFLASILTVIVFYEWMTRGLWTG